MPLRIGNGAGFLGDHLDAPRRLVASAELDYLTLEYLAELTLSILAHQRKKDPTAGYAADFLTVMKSLLPVWPTQPNLKIITNGGGMNPVSCAQAVGRLLTEQGLGGKQIAATTGDDLLPRLAALQTQGCTFEHFDDGRPLAELGAPVVSANAYLGALPIVQALQAGAQIVITGRVADASLTVGPAVHAFGWDWQDWNLLAGATVAGHLIECGSQVTGGYSTAWEQFRLADVGYPIAEMEPDGSCVITKPAGSGGAVDLHTVTEQLVYEIGDPAHYLTPDVDADFTAVELSAAGQDRVRATAAKGRAPPETYKVSLAYQAGFSTAFQLLVYGSDCVAKAQACTRIVKERLARQGIVLDQLHEELLGLGGCVPGLVQPRTDLQEVVWRLVAKDKRKEALTLFAAEMAPLITSGPAGLAGYTVPRGAVIPVYAYWPSRVPRALVEPQVLVKSAADWAQSN